MSEKYAHYLLVIGIRNIVVFAVLLVGLRLSGKRNLGQFNVYDIALIMLLQNAVQNAMTTGSGNLSVGIVSALVILACGRILSALFLLRPAMEPLLAGRASVLINDGVVVEANMKRERISQDELASALRMHGVESPQTVEMAVLETDGTITVVKREAKN